MPHDSKGNLLKPGDHVALLGTVKSIDCEQETYCNATFVPDIGMAPDAEPTSQAVSARTLTLLEPDAVAENASGPELPSRGTPSSNVAETKALRRDLDGVLQIIKTAVRNSRERSIAITKIQEAIMWLGMDLKAMHEDGVAGTENPYPQSYNPSSPVIEPTADGLKL